MREIVYTGFVLGPEYGADEHYVYRATITEEILHRVALLAKKAKQLDVFCIQLFDNSVQVFSRWPIGMPDAIFHGDGEPDEPNPDYPFDPEQHGVYPDCLKLSVYDDGDFSWSWYPKHGGRHERCDTETFNLHLIRRAMKESQPA